MFIYYSPPSPVRVIVVGEFNRDKEELSLAVSRCSKRDFFQKKTMIYPSRPSFNVQTSKGLKIIPARPERVVRGGLQIAIDRLENNEILGVFPMKVCSSYSFVYIAEVIAKQVIENPNIIEELKNGK